MYRLGSGNKAATEKPNEASAHFCSCQSSSAIQRQSMMPDAKKCWGWPVLAPLRWEIFRWYQCVYSTCWSPFSSFKPFSLKKNETALLQGILNWRATIAAVKKYLLFPFCQILPLEHVGLFLFSIVHNDLNIELSVNFTFFLSFVWLSFCYLKTSCST